MSDLPWGSGYPFERRAKTGYALPAARRGEERRRKLPLKEGLAAYQLVGEVTAHQGDDG